jgi:hypothetical protein
MKTSKILSLVALLLVSTFFFGFVKKYSSVVPPKIQVSIDDVTGGTISIKQLSSAAEIRAKLTSIDPQKVVLYKVDAYTLAIAPKKTGTDPEPKSFIAQVQGNKISKDIKDRLLNLHPEDLVVIANVKATAPDGTQSNISGATYSVQ